MELEGAAARPWSRSRGSTGRHGMWPVNEWLQLRPVGRQVPATYTGGRLPCAHTEVGQTAIPSLPMHVPLLSAGRQTDDLNSKGALYHPCRRVMCLVARLQPQWDQRTDWQYPMHFAWPTSRSSYMHSA